MAISSYLAELHNATTAQGTYAKLLDIKDFPDMIGDPNLLETTTLSDGAQTYIPGIKSSDLLTFTANYTSADFAAVKALEGTEQFWKLIFSDESELSWSGQVTAGLPGKGVDEVVEMTLNITPSSEIIFTPAP